ncbi:hypothetical protein [Planktothricoides raciborskii]|uniref:CRISPR-associated protein n=1 Tax=Planktothricoides raciborskii GIHE-MW2 TaxID=2792601 RepID=A0AAU8J6W5_9CYAN
MIGQQLNLFEQNFQDSSLEVTSCIVPKHSPAFNPKILLSALVAKVIPNGEIKTLISILSSQPMALGIAKQLGDPRIIRELKQKKRSNNQQFPEIKCKGSQIFYQGRAIGKLQILYKSPLPGELQARLATESAIERFLDYLQKVHHIVVLEESDYHVRVFIPGNLAVADLRNLWEDFIKNVAFSAYGEPKHQLPGLVQTFIAMLNSVTLSGRGFSTLDVPILTEEQANVLAAWYLAVIRDVQNRQKVRQQQIDRLKKQISDEALSEKDLKSQQKQLKDKEEMQAKEAKKYLEYFHKSFGKILDEQEALWKSLEDLEAQLGQSGLTKAQQKKLQNQQNKLTAQIIWSNFSVQQKRHLFEKSKGDTFEFVELDRKQNRDKFKQIEAIAKTFTKTATDQINSTRGDIFTQCIVEMYRLMENEIKEDIPEPLLTEKPRVMEARSPGDDSKEFCYSCGVAIDPKTARWQVLRFMFERPSQRRQSASSEGRPHICASCSALAFASPLKVTDESIILKLESKDTNNHQNFRDKQEKFKDYLRMVTTGQLHLNAGRYLILASDKTNKGDIASAKLGQVQYALAKVASIFPREVLADFNFSLIYQGSEGVALESRHLIFIKGLIEGYGQSIIISGKDINMTLGEAVRYVEKDLPILAEYTTVKDATVSSNDLMRQLNNNRQAYFERIWKDLNLDSQGECMASDNLMFKKAKIYRDVAALTGLLYPFILAFKKNATNQEKPEDVKREVGKLIEKVDDNASIFSYCFGLYCPINYVGEDKRTFTQVRLYRNPDIYFIYDQAKKFLEDNLNITGRENQKNDGDKSHNKSLTLYPNDLMAAYEYLSNPDRSGYKEEKDWRDLTYQLKLSLYIHFPEQLRKEKTTTSEK